MDLVRTFTAEQYRRALADWQWLPVAGKKPLCASPFGDVFLFDVSGAIWLISTLEGTLERVFDSRDHFVSAIATRDGQDEYLSGSLALAAEAAGLVLGADDVYAHTVPPILGGSFEVANVQTLSFVVAVSIAGQLHRQVKDLPPGTRISHFFLDESPRPAERARGSVLRRLLRRPR